MLLVILCLLAVVMILWDRWRWINKPYNRCMSGIEILAIEEDLPDSLKLRFFDHATKRHYDVGYELRPEDLYDPEADDGAGTEDKPTITVSCPDSGHHEARRIPAQDEPGINKLPSANSDSWPTARRS